MSSSPGLTILVADDSPVYRKLIAQALSQENCTVLYAKNGRQAVDLFAEHRPALVITDWTMPDQESSIGEMALTDPLTGLPNRRAIDLWATLQLSACARHDFPIWVVMADLDHFKKINDTHGHNAGDVVLKTFAEALKSNTRSSNICGRLGGEEFLVVITHVEKENVAIAIERRFDQSYLCT